MVPWVTPTLRSVRERVRDDITAMLPGSAVVGNTVLRVMADADAGLCHMTLRYIDWVALQLMPDTAEKEWLDRHADIWLVNSDGTIGRKDATYADGTATFTGTAGITVPTGTLLAFGDANFETLADGVVSDAPAEIPVRAITAGSVANMDPGTKLSLRTPVLGVDSLAIVVTLDGGADTENDTDLRIRVLERIQQPPMGGAQYDYVAWAKAVPGVTRAWAYPEQGPGTITVRFMMDELRAPTGFPLPEDEKEVAAYVNQKRPVTVMDCFVLGPIPFPLDFTISNLSPADAATQNAIDQSINDMLFLRAAPGQTIYRSWVDEAISEAIGERSHELTFTTTAMPAPGYMATIGTIYFEPPA
jgi:uncharacterized phage protein gp47/JayE